MTFEDELKALRLLHTQLRPFPREHRDRLIRQVQDALNREEQRPRGVGGLTSVCGFPIPPQPIEHIELAPPPDAA